jgi:acetyl esterase/lipase
MSKKFMSNFPSPGMRIVSGLLRLRGSDFKGKRFARLRTQLVQRAYPVHAPPPARLERRQRVETQRVNGHLVYTVAPSHKPIAQVLYTHGGAFVHSLQTVHWDIIGKLVQHMGARVTVPLYPLAPEHNYRETFPLLEAVYRRVLTDAGGQPVILCGDSAGGTLALAQAQSYRDQNLRAPDRIVLFSPWLDLTLSNPDAAAVEPRDPVLGIEGLRVCGRWWSGGDDLRLPFLSPVCGELSGLPPVDIFQGTADIFLPDTRALRDKVAAAGGEIQLNEYPDAFHAFVVATALPEAADVFARLRANHATPKRSA